MRQFFLQQADYLDFQYGFLLVFVGMIGYSLWRGKDTKLPWKWLALYGLIGGLREWLQIYAFQLEGDTWFTVIEALLAALSFACLVEFGRKGLRAHGTRVPGPWIQGVLFCLALPALFLGPEALESAFALSMGVPGSILAAIAFIRSRTLKSAGIVMAVHAVLVAFGPAARFWPASVLNKASFAAFAGFPIDIPRIIVLSLFCAIMVYEYRLTWGSTGRATAFALGIIVILAGGWVGTQIAGLRAAQAARAQLSEDTTTIMSAINPAHLRGLTLSPADLESPVFMRLREQLVTIAAANSDEPVITLTVEREGKIYFVTDSLPQGHANHARPGDPYDEYPPELHTVSVTGQPAIAGPYTDQRGTFISGFSAIRDLASGEVLGVLGVDWEYPIFALAVTSSRLIPISLTIIASLCFLVYHIFRQGSREAAQLLAASERSLRLAQAISRVGSWVRDCRSGKSEWSAEMFTIFGVDSARGTPTIEEMRALLVSGDWERELEAEERAESDGVGFELDLRIVRPDGGVLYVVSKGEPVRDQHGKVTSVAGILQDLTVQHKAQAEVRRLAQQMEFILAASRTGLDIIDSSYNLRYVDPGWQKVYGDPAGRKCHEYFMERDTPCPDCGIMRALATKTISVTEETLPREGNRPIQVTTIPFQSEDGEWLVAEVNVDISERKRAEEKNTRLAALVESSEEAITGFSMERYVTVWNRGAERTYGFSAAEAMGKPSSMLIPADREEEAKELLKRLLGGERLERFETVRRRKDGALIPVAETLSLIRDAEGNLIGLAVVARDITADKAIQAQLIRAQRLESLGTLASGIAHQFNNINTVIKSYLELLVMDKVQGKALVYVQEALKGVERAVDITERLLGFTNVARSEGETSHLEDVARSIFPLLADRFKEAGVLLRDELVATPAVKAGASMAGFVATGLLSNALHAVLGMPEGMVAIRTGVMPGFSFLEVSDTGCGMAIEDVRRIFTPFFTTKGEWAPKGSPQASVRGIGLTLAVSQATATEQGGRIEVQSMKGKGSTFRLLLPFASEAPAGP